MNNKSRLQYSNKHMISTSPTGVEMSKWTGKNYEKECFECVIKNLQDVTTEFWQLRYFSILVWYWAGVLDSKYDKSSYDARACLISIFAVEYSSELC